MKSYKTTKRADELRKNKASNSNPRENDPDNMEMLHLC